MGFSGEDIFRYVMLVILLALIGYIFPVEAGALMVGDVL